MQHCISQFRIDNYKYSYKRIVSTTTTTTTTTTTIIIIISHNMM